MAYKNKEERLAYGTKWRLANPEKARAAVDRYNKAHPDRKREQEHKGRYGEPLSNKQKRLEEQGFRCANPGCRTPYPGPKGWHTDHNHITGKVRGELCRDCNLALGLLDDDKFKAEGLAEYLRKTDG